MAKKFTSAAAFKASLEDRLRTRAKEHSIPFQTLQLKFVMERLLARLFSNTEVPWLLKGALRWISAFVRRPGPRRTSTSRWSSRRWNTFREAGSYLNNDLPHDSWGRSNNYGVADALE